MSDLLTHHRPLGLFTALALLAACAGRPATGAAGDQALPQDTAWIEVKGPMLIGFYPIVTNAQIDSSQDLATILDDFAYHFGAATDTLAALGFAQTMQGGDTVRLRAGPERWIVVRARDSADVGYLFVDPSRRQTMVYGVRTDLDLYQEAREFLRMGRVSAP